MCLSLWRGWSCRGQVCLSEEGLRLKTVGLSLWGERLRLKRKDSVSVSGEGGELQTNFLATSVNDKHLH